MDDFDFFSIQDEKTRKVVSKLLNQVVKLSGDSRDTQTELQKLNEIQGELLRLSATQNVTQTELQRLNEIQADIQQLGEIRNDVQRLSSAQGENQGTMDRLNEIQADIQQLGEIRNDVQRLSSAQGENQGTIDRLDHIQADVQRLENIQGDLHQLREIRSDVQKLNEGQRDNRAAYQKLESIQSDMQQLRQVRSEVQHLNEVQRENQESLQRLESIQSEVQRLSSAQNETQAALLRLGDIQTDIQRLMYAQVQIQRLLDAQAESQRAGGIRIEIQQLREELSLLTSGMRNIEGQSFDGGPKIKVLDAGEGLDIHPPQSEGPAFGTIDYNPPKITEAAIEGTVQDLEQIIEEPLSSKEDAIAVAGFENNGPGEIDLPTIQKPGLPGKNEGESSETGLIQPDTNFLQEAYGHPSFEEDGIDYPLITEEKRIKIPWASFTPKLAMQMLAISTIFLLIIVGIIIFSRRGNLFSFTTKPVSTATPGVTLTADVEPLPTFEPSSRFPIGVGTRYNAFSIILFFNCSISEIFEEIFNYH